jgi:putative NIF3 family GTP cyclohydrolase 1 type 2
VKRHIGVERLRVARASRIAGTSDVDARVRTVGVCAGSGASMLSNAQCDLWLTGEAGE